MQFSLMGERDPFLHVSLNAGEYVYAESDAMVTMEDNLDLKASMQGGFFSSLARRMANGESFFNEYIEATRGPGDVLLAPSLPGDINILTVGGGCEYYLNDGAFLAAEPSVEMTTEMQSIGRALFGGTGGFFIMRARGRGLLAIAGYGSIIALDIEPGNPLTIDNKHVIAWDASLRYELSMSTRRSQGFLGNLINSAMSSEGIVTRFSGKGRVYVSSRNIGGLTAYMASQISSQGNQ